MVSASECFTTFQIYYTYRLQKYRNKLMALYQGKELYLRYCETTYYQNYQGMVLGDHPHCLGDIVFPDTPPPSCPVLRNLDYQCCPVYRICNCLLSQLSAEGHKSPNMVILDTRHRKIDTGNIGHTTQKDRYGNIGHKTQKDRYG